MKSEVRKPNPVSYYSTKVYFYYIKFCYDQLILMNSRDFSEFASFI